MDDELLPENNHVLKDDCDAPPCAVVVSRLWDESEFLRSKIAEVEGRVRALSGDGSKSALREARILRAQVERLSGEASALETRARALVTAKGMSTPVRWSC